MKRSLIAAMLILLGMQGCSQMQNPFASHSASAKAAPQTPPQNAAVNTDYSNQTYAANTGDCAGLANKRMAMFDRPSTYPMSDKEKHDAYQALYTECVNGNTTQIAAASHNNVAANSNTAAEFANLSPAAGGTASRAGASIVSAGGVSTSTVAGATVVVIGGNKDTASQLSSLSPSSGSSSPQPTVILVQAPTQPAPIPANYGTAASGYLRPTGPLPVAVPVAPPMAQGSSVRTQTVTTQTVPLAAMPQRTMAASAPSLAGADTAATGYGYTPARGPAQTATAQQVENDLEK